MTPANEDLRELKKILEDFFTGLPVKVYLFGSAARGALRQSSDLDVGILPLAPLPVGLLSELREHLEMSNLIYPVDVVDLSEVSADFRSRVIAEGIEWIGSGND
ncbi:MULTISPECIES: nucleotidyltransferase family protein [unclassified Thermosynechococcus]|uniref:nucleotidyltransferase family protein n=1 Tax=unclassified Thermosynechococcus TaxID=2622553 RepID=UPI0026733CFD|nr:MULTISPECIES: nucleotidyltransferase domain-containing protein [unclassified Thermosynechococcus]WKT84706.1 nucleotidyltransferase domain-containing protein [Thermosynechococcus sp. HY596]WNC63841.1 nucleotidyltransferase domain-containing protein [Thermosynechococcus sp. HY591]WNC66405.1 nucleotidyltransferase domain-containing protein [Thermosynechococcus sp. HY593]